MRTHAWLAVGGLLVVACGGEPAGTTTGAQSTTATTAGSSSSSGQGSGPETTGMPTTSGAGTGTGDPSTTTTTGGSSGTTGDPTTGEPVEPDPWVERRGAVHVHSPYSHDACDGQGLMNGEPNASCLADLRAALCASGHAFVMLTDHPAYMKDHPFERVLLHSAADGDQLVMQGGASYNRVQCPDDRSVLLAAGYESTHTLPLGLHHHVDPALYAGLTDAEPLPAVQALVAGLKAGGAVVAIAHSEEADLSAARIVEVGLDAMEWYNPHGNFKNALGGDNIAGNAQQVLDLLQGLQPFMAGSNSGAHADLVYLRLLQSWPTEGFAKWREVQRSRAVTGLLGSDVHQNVAVEPICDDPNPVLQAACVAAAEAVLPEALAGLVAGGTIKMSDGDRLDSYARILRWLENRVLTPPGELDLAQLQDALRGGRSYGLFSVFGGPEGLRFAGRVGEELLWIGDSSPGPVTFEVRVPPRPVPLGGAAFTPEEGEAALVRTMLWRTDGADSTLVMEVAGLGEEFTFEGALPGAYHLEIWVRPEHLRGALGSEGELAEHEYLWVITNPIRVTP